MGAESRADIIKGTTAREAYNAAADRAAWESGNGGYTGTIAESNGYKVARPRTRLEAERAAETLLSGGTIDGLQAKKWEYTVLIPILADRDTRTIDLAVDVTGTERYGPDEQGQYSTRDRWTAAVYDAATGKVRKGEHVMAVEWYTEGQRSWTSSPLPAAAALAKRTIRSMVARTKGEQATVWAVVTGTGSGSTIHATSPDLEQAKRAATEVAQRAGRDRVGIVQMKVRDGDADGFLYTARHEVVKNVLGARIAFGRATGGESGEYLAVGVYSS